MHTVKSQSLQYSFIPPQHFYLYYTDSSILLLVHLIFLCFLKKNFKFYIIVD